MAKKKKQMSALFCEHANEMPLDCPCPKNCYCKAHSCKKVLKVQNGSKPESKATRKPREPGFHWAFKQNVYTGGDWVLVNIFHGIKKVKDLEFGCALEEESGKMVKVSDFIAFVKIDEPPWSVS